MSRIKAGYQRPSSSHHQRVCIPRQPHSPFTMSASEVSTNGKSNGLHKMLEEYEYKGFFMSGTMTSPETLAALEAGKGPQYEAIAVTYPRTGTARLVEIMWLIMNNCDTQKAKELKIAMRHLFLDVCSPDFKSCFDKPVPPPEGQRLAKTHLPWELMEKHVDRPGVKFVVGLRNPKDSLVSLFHFYKMCNDLGNFQGTFDDFFELFRAKHLMYGDSVEFSIGWWNQRNRDNIYVCFYEDFNENPFEEVEKLAKFLGKDLSKEQINTIVQWTSFNNMKNEKSTNYEDFKRFDSKVSPYMRKATVGDWANYLSEEQSKYIDQQCEEKCHPLGLKFRF